jgi:hypothetical protein
VVTPNRIFLFDFGLNLLYDNDNLDSQKVQMLFYPKNEHIFAHKHTETPALQKAK